MKKRIISQAVSLALITLAVTPANAADYSGVTLNTSTGVLRGANTYTNVNLNIDNNSGIENGTHEFFSNSTVNVTGYLGILDGTFIFRGNTLINLGVNPANSWTTSYYNSATVNADGVGSYSRGAHTAYDSTTINLNSEQSFTEIAELEAWYATTVNVNAENAVDGGTMIFREFTEMNASHSRGITGGSQTFYVLSKLNATASNAITGGTQNFYDSSSLILTGSISGGTQDFTGTSELLLKSGSYINGGTQRFTGSSKMILDEVGAGFNVQGGIIDLAGVSSTLDLGTNNSLTVSDLIGNGTVFSSGTAGTMSRLIIDDYGTQTFSGQIISGPAEIDVRKTGPGTFNLTGTINTQRDLAIDGGKFLANGSVLTPNTIVNANSTIGGSGTVNNLIINNAGILAPGNSIGTLNVAGNLSFNPLSTYEVEVNDQGQSDHTAVAGVATLAGTVNVIAETGSYHSGLVFNILSASGGIVNEFDHLNTNLAFLSPELTYQGNDVLITFVSNGVTPGQVSVIGGGNSNQQGVADSLPSVTSPAIGQAIQGLSVTGAMNAYTQLGGELHATAHAGMIEDSDFLRSSVVNRLANHDGNEAWMKVTNIDASTGKTGLNDDASRRANAALFGVDRQVGNDDAWTVGVVGGYGNTNTSTLRSTGRADTAHIGAYLGRAIDQVNVKVGLGYAYHSVDTERKINFGTFNSKIKGDYAAHSVQAFADVGYAFRVGAGTVEPFLNVAGVQINRESFRERNSDAALSVKSENTFTTFTTAGVRLNQPVFQYRGADVALVGSVGFRNAAGDVTPSSTQRIGDGGVFNTQGNPIARNAVVFDLGLNAKITDTLVAGVGYRGQSGDNLRSHATSFNLNWLF